MRLAWMEKMEDYVLDTIRWNLRVIEGIKGSTVIVKEFTVADCVVGKSSFHGKYIILEHSHMFPNISNVSGLQVRTTFFEGISEDRPSWVSIERKHREVKYISLSTRLGFYVML